MLVGCSDVDGIKRPGWENVPCPLPLVLLEFELAGVLDEEGVGFGNDLRGALSASFVATSRSSNRSSDRAWSKYLIPCRGSGSIPSVRFAVSESIGAICPRSRITTVTVISVACRLVAKFCVAAVLAAVIARLRNAS